MSFFGGRSYSDSERIKPSSSSHHNSSSSHARAVSPSRSTTNNGYYTRPSAGRSSSSTFFGAGGSSRGIFGSSSGGGGSSYYKRRPRDGYISYLIHKLQRMVKELWYYARRNPVKAFFAVVVPLLSAGGAIHGLLRQFNIKVPFVDGGTSYSRGAGGYYGSSGYGGGGRAGGGLGGLGSMSGMGGGLMENAGSLMQFAKAFM